MSFETFEENKEKKEIPNDPEQTEEKMVDYEMSDFSAIEAEERKDALKKIQELEKKSGLKLSKTEDEIEEKIEKLENLHNTKEGPTEKKLEKRELYENMVNEIKNEILEHVGSREYQEKLQIEYNGNAEKAEREQKKRIGNLETVKINILSKEELKNKLEDIRRKSGVKFGNFDAFYVRDCAGIKHELFVPFDNDDEGYCIEQELLHASTKIYEGMSDKAVKLLDKSYIKQGLFGVFSNKQDRYYKDPSERLVRKQMLDRELEALGIKKYGEKFADKHYDKMMEYYKKGKFSWDANDFIKRTNPKRFKQIFNEIAANEEEVEVKLT